MDGDRLREKIHDSGVSISDVAERCGFKGTGSVSTLFTRTNISTASLEKIAEAINKPVGWFYDDFPNVSVESFINILQQKSIDLSIIADALEISLSSLNYKFKTTRNVPYYILERAAQVIGCKISYFWGEVDDDQSSPENTEYINQLLRNIALQSKIIQEQAKIISDSHEIIQKFSGHLQGGVISENELTKIG